MPAAASTVASLLTTDALISNSFYLDINNEGIITSLSGVSGLDVEVDVISGQQVGKGGIMQNFKTLGNQTKVGDLSLTRLAPMDSTTDKLWVWFNAIRDGGLVGSNRGMSQRKNGSIVIYDTANTEVTRFNFFNGWPSKISTDALSSDGNDAVKETITLSIERLERKISNS